MSDFAQAGLICTLQRLNETHLADIEEAMPALAASCPVSLILPCHTSDLERPALAHIAAELASTAWLREIVVSLNGPPSAGLPRVFDAIPNVRILRNDGPELASRHAQSLGLPADAAPHGKGLNVWAAIGLVCSERRSEAIAVIDCDVSSFKRSSLSRLCYPLMHPSLAFAFAKMYYSRVTDRLYGRVSRLFLAPLLQAIVRLLGHGPLVDFLLAFRYPLAGECAIRRDLADRLPLESGWGLEIGMLCELHRQIDPRSVCQVDGGPGYDHKHQNPSPALQKMAAEIAGTLLANLEKEGATITPSLVAELRHAYRREATLAVQRSAALALINSLPFHPDREIEMVALFGETIAAQPNARLELPPHRSRAASVAGGATAQGAPGPSPSSSP